MKRWACIFIIYAGMLLGMAKPAQALKISPFKASIEAGATVHTQVFRVENNTDDPAAVQVSVATWQMQPDGTEINEDAGDEFAVFPAQLVLKPHESRGVRVQWLGQVPPEKEKPFRVIAEEVPIKLKETPAVETGVKFMLKFKAALYLIPKMPQTDVKSDVVIKSYERQSDGSLRLELINNGTIHTLMRNPVLEISSGDGTPITLSGEVLKPIDGENIHAGVIRIFNIPMPPGTSAASIAGAKLSFENGY